MTDKYDTPSAQFLERKLSTILSADVAEFSRLMGEDEEQTLRTFRGHKKVFESLIAMHHGRIFNTAGDAILAEFPSAVEAVRCATDIQAALRTRNDQLEPNRQVRFRIGINLGDVMVQGQDLMGDGVNVAARLQTAAEPGGICISGTVHDQIRNKLSLSFHSLGEMNFKNIQQPVRTFSITEAEGTGPLPSRQSSAIAVSNIKWIAAAAVLLFLGGAFWAYTSYHRSTAQSATIAASVPSPAQQPQATAPPVALPSPETTQSTLSPPTESASQAAAKLALKSAAKPRPAAAPPIQAMPASNQTPNPVAAAPRVVPATSDYDGIYSGQICFGEIPKDPKRCFHAEGTASGTKLYGKWPMGPLDKGVFMTLTGDIDPSGNLKIEMHSKAPDGTVINNIYLTGILQNGLIKATGSFKMGRAVTLNWQKN